MSKRKFENIEAFEQMSESLQQSIKGGYILPDDGPTLKKLYSSTTSTCTSCTNCPPPPYAGGTTDYYYDVSSDVVGIQPDIDN